MASKIVSSINIPTLSQLYLSSALQPATSSVERVASAKANSSVGLIRGDITKLQVDAIVNAAKNSLLGGGGVDGVVHRAAGPELLSECRSIGGCPTGEARITKGYNLPAKHVIHTVGPVYSGEETSAPFLRNCYRNSLELAAKSGIRSIAFAGISTGIYGYPSLDAAQIACATVRNFLDETDSPLQKVIFVTFEQKDVDAYDEMLPIYFPPVQDS